MSLRLYRYQQDYTDKVNCRNWIYDCDTGTGKTIMALYHYVWFIRKHLNPNKLLIVAPASKINEGGWQRTIKDHFLIVDYETCTYNMLPKKWREFEDYFVIFDECHRIKNSTGVWGKSAYNLSKIASGFILLSATPIPNGWEDSINYFKMFGLTKNKTQFLKINALMGYDEYGILNIYGWKNETKLKNMWRGISRRLNKDEAIDLPPIVFKDVYFPKTHPYDKALKDRVYGDELLDNSMKLRHTLRQITSPICKFEYVADFLQNTTENVLIFYNYDSELEILKKVNNKPLYVCNGHEKNYPKKDDWDSIKNTVTLANYKSGSEAVEFTYATIIIYFSPTDSYTEFYQSYGRCHRVGQTNKITAYKFITKDTIEEDIYTAIDHKQDFNFDLWLENERKK